MGKVMRERIKQLDELGEEELFERIASGMTVKSLILGMGMGWRAFYKWVDAEEGRRGRYEDALKQAGHAYAARAVETAQNATNENVAVARLQVDTDKWIASKLNAAYDVRQKEVNVTVTIEDLHAQAAAMIAEQAERAVIDAVYEDVTEADGEEE